MTPPASNPRGPVLRNSLRANAQPFTPTHASQPIRRQSQNPTFVQKTPTKRSSMHGNMRSAAANAAQNNAKSQERNENNPNPAKQQATSFASDAFGKRNTAAAAAKVFAAKKRAAMKTNEQKKLDAQKHFARRQSMKAAKRAAAAASHQDNAPVATGVPTTPTSSQGATPGSAASPDLALLDAPSAIEAATAEVATAVADAAMKLAETELAECMASQPKDDEEASVSVPSSRPSSTSSTPSVDNVDAPSKSHHVDAGMLSPSVSVSTITDAAQEEMPSVPSVSTASIDVHPTRQAADVEEVPKEVPSSSPQLVLESIGSVTVQPTVQSAFAQSKRHSMTVLPSCAVSICAKTQQMSSCTMSTVSGGSYSNSANNSGTTAIPTHGKWCNECAGVGLHISAMMSTMAGWRAEEERRSSQTSSSGNASSSSSSKGGIMRRMSQSLIGNTSAPRSSDATREKERLKQQVDVLSMTVKFLHEKLERVGAATPDVIDALRRCS